MKNCWKTLKAISSYAQKVLIKMCKPSKNYPSRDTAPLNACDIHREKKTVRDREREYCASSTFRL